MYFNVPAHQEDSLYHDALELAGISDTGVFTLKAFCRSANDYIRRSDSWIWESVGDWQFDDTNLSDTPVLMKDSLAGIAKYRLPATTRRIERVEVKDTSDVYNVVYPIDKSQIQDVALSEYYKNAGNPITYDLTGNKITFYPAFSTVRTNAIKFYVSRDIHPFAMADTDAEPGFDNHFHRIISFGAAYDESLRNQDKERAAGLKIEIERMKQEMMTFYSKRHPDFKNQIRPSIYESAARL